MSLIKYQIHQPVFNVQRRLLKICGLLISMENSLSQIKWLLMNSIPIKLRVKNPRSISVFVEVRDDIEQILKIFVPNMIKSDF